MGEPLMDSPGKESVRTSLNSFMRELHRAWIWVASWSIFRRGKPSGMTLKFLRSLNPTIISSLTAGDTTADVLVLEDGAWSTISTIPVVGTGSPLTETRLVGGGLLVDGDSMFYCNVR